MVLGHDHRERILVVDLVVEVQEARGCGGVAAGAELLVGDAERGGQSRVRREPALRVGEGLFRPPDLAGVAADGPAGPVPLAGRVDDRALDAGGGVAGEGDTRLLPEPGGRLDQAEGAGVPQLGPVDMGGIARRDLVDRMLDEVEVIEDQVFPLCSNDRHADLRGFRVFPLSDKVVSAT